MFSIFYWPNGQCEFNHIIVQFDPKLFCVPFVEQNGAIGLQQRGI